MASLMLTKYHTDQEVYMMNQHEVRSKLLDIKSGVQNLWERLHHRLDTRPSDQADGIVDTEEADKLVWDDDKQIDTGSGQVDRYS